MMETVADPACPDNGVVLKVGACGVCRSDFHGWTGEHPKVHPGAILGHEYCGTVVKAGPRAAHKVGERLGCRVTTAWHALTDRAALRAGEWVAVHGTGGIGLATLLLAKMLGARVVVVDVVEEKLAHAQALGADAAFNAEKVDAAAAIREITGGGAQVSVEALGIAQTTNASVDCLATLARHVHVGMPAWKNPSLLGMIERGEVDIRPMVAREVSLWGPAPNFAR
jgi:D-arabinose 1-dehydrogenase-like Zn-dependent alcohol dehydrogenase